MRRVKKVYLSLFAVISAVAMMATSVYATTYTNESKRLISDSNLSAFAQQIPEQVAEIQNDDLMNDFTKIEEILTQFFEAKRDQIENPTLGDFDFSIFWDASSTHVDDLSYFERSVKLEKETFAIFNQYAGNSNTELTFRDVSVSGETAEVHVYEWFEYQYCSATNGSLIWPSTTGSTSGTGIPYTISMRKIDGCWLITDIIFFNNATESLKDSSINVDAFVQTRYEAATTVSRSVLLAGSEEGRQAEPNGPVRPPLPEEPTVISLDIGKFVSYAAQYAGSNRNPLFPDFSSIGGDCQNFASQCIWYGLGGISSDAEIRNASQPMVNPNWAGSTSREWYVKKDWSHSPSWTEVNSFANNVAGGASSDVGLYGTVYEGYANAQTGDIIQYRIKGDDKYQHSYVVVGVSGTYGSREADNIAVCAHTTDITATLLSNRLDSSFEYRTIHVSGVKFPPRSPILDF